MSVRPCARRRCCDAFIDYRPARLVRNAVPNSKKKKILFVVAVVDVVAVAAARKQKNGENFFLDSTRLPFEEQQSRFGVRFRYPPPCRRKKGPKQKAIAIERQRQVDVEEKRLLGGVANETSAVVANRRQRKSSIAFSIE